MVFRRNVGFLGRHLGVRDHVEIDEMDRRQVDGNVKVLVGAQQVSNLFAHTLHQPSGHRHDRARLLGQRNEHVGFNDPTLRVSPADQRFAAGAAVFLEVHYRLVMYDELMLIKGFPQFVAERRPSHCKTDGDGDDGEPDDPSDRSINEG